MAPRCMHCEKRVVELSRMLASAEHSRNHSGRTPSAGSSTTEEGSGGEEVAARRAATHAQLRELLAARVDEVVFLQRQVVHRDEQLATLREDADAIRRERDSARAAVVFDPQAQVGEAANGALSARGASTQQLTPHQQRELTRRVVEQANTILAIRRERDAALASLAAVRRDHAAEVERAERLESKLDVVATHTRQLDQQTDWLQQLRSCEAELKDARVVIAEHERRGVAFAQFRSEHAQCGEALVDLRLQVFTAKTREQTLAKEKAAVERQCEEAWSAVAKMRQQLRGLEHDREQHRRHAENERQRLTSELSERTRLVDELRKCVDEATMASEVARGSLEHARRELDTVRASLEEVRSAKAAADDAARMNVAGDVGRLLRDAEESATRMAELEQANASLTQNLRLVRREHADAAEEHRARLRDLASVKDDLGTVTAQYEAKAKSYERLRTEFESLVNRVNEMEGSHMDIETTSSRRLTGMLESINAELAEQIGEHLRLEYLRGGLQTGALLQRVFNLTPEVAESIAVALSQLYATLRTSADVSSTCRLLGVKEITVRRTLMGFREVIERHQPGSRRRALLLETASQHRWRFSGDERLYLLQAVRRSDPPDLEDSRRSSSSSSSSSSRPVYRLGGERLVLANVCSFLPPVIAGHPMFAIHRRGSSGDDAQSVMLHLMGMGVHNTARDEQSFRFVEAQLSADKVVAVEFCGTWSTTPTEEQRRGGEKDEAPPRQPQPNEQAQFAVTPGLVTLYLHAATCRHTSGDLVDWTPSDRFEAPRSLVVRWERNHNGIVAQLASGAKLPEVSKTEATFLEDFLRPGTSSTSLLSHSSWTNVGVA